jgi:hypothetical protein
MIPRFEYLSLSTLPVHTPIAWPLDRGQPRSTVAPYFALSVCRLIVHWLHLCSR